MLERNSVLNNDEHWSFNKCKITFPLIYPYNDAETMILTPSEVVLIKNDQNQRHLYIFNIWDEVKQFLLSFRFHCRGVVENIRSFFHSCELLSRAESHFRGEKSFENFCHTSTVEIISALQKKRGDVLINRPNVYSRRG